MLIFILIEGLDMMFKETELLQLKQSFTVFSFNGNVALHLQTNHILVEFPRNETALQVVAPYGLQEEKIIFKARLFDEMRFNLKKIKTNAPNRERFLQLIAENLLKLSNPAEVRVATDCFLSLSFKDNSKIELDLVLKAIFDALSEK